MCIDIIVGILVIEVVPRLGRSLSRDFFGSTPPRHAFRSAIRRQRHCCRWAIGATTSPMGRPVSCSLTMTTGGGSSADRRIYTTKLLSERRVGS